MKTESLDSLVGDRNTSELNLVRSREELAELLKMKEAAEQWALVESDCQHGSCCGDSFAASEILAGRGPKK